MQDDNLIRELFNNSLAPSKSSGKKTALDLYYEQPSLFRKPSYPVPTYLEIMAKITKPKKFVSIGDRHLIERQRAIAAHYLQQDIKELNRLALAERKSRYLDPANPFKK